MRTILLAAVAALLAACSVNLDVLRDPPRSAAVLTAGPWASMIYVARVDAGVIAVDLGWDGEGDALRGALATIGATPDDVIAVFLTHSHRDHIAAWPLVSDARFYLAAREVPRFLGREAHHGVVPVWVARMKGVHRPEPGRLDIHPLLGDTAIAFGDDTVRVFPIPGHTAGSAAYLFRDVLFVGDAVTWTPLRGFHSARRIYSDDVARNRASLVSLWKRVAPFGVGYACTAHGKCAVVDSVFLRRALR